jgi:hypothetical protein
MTRKKLLVLFGIILMIISVPFTVIHLLANPDDAPITPIPHMVAALANFLGPWGVAIVRCVDFPNAGMRSFSWMLAIVLTMCAVLLIGLALCAKRRAVQYLSVIVWAVFLVLWFGVGLRQIAHGLL